MKRLLLFVALVVTTGTYSGCAACCSPFDYAYPSYGGKWERGDRFWGRVGSPLSGAGTMVDGNVVDGAIYSDNTTLQYPVEEGPQVMLNPATEYSIEY